MSEARYHEEPPVPIKDALRTLRVFVKTSERVHGRESALEALEAIEWLHESYEALAMHLRGARSASESAALERVFDRLRTDYKFGDRLYAPGARRYGHTRHARSILWLLYQARGRLVRKGAIQEALEANGYSEQSDNMMKVYVTRIRSDFRVAGLPDPFITVRGEGYRASPDLIELFDRLGAP